MIVLICGPSGGGKTTLLAALARCCRCTVIALFVSRKKPRKNAEIGRTEVSPSQFRRLKSSLRFQYSYDDSLYGFSIPDSFARSSEYAFIDYPGEYPVCSELCGVPWRGVLVLPPSRQTLEKRLNRERRANRIATAIKEYSECLDELKRGQYCGPQWRVYISEDRITLKRFVADVVAGELFVTAGVS